MYTTICRCGGTVSRETAEPHKVVGHTNEAGESVPCRLDAE